MVLALNSAYPRHREDLCQLWATLQSRLCFSISRNLDYCYADIPTGTELDLSGLFQPVRPTKMRSWPSLIEARVPLLKTTQLFLPRLTNVKDSCFLVNQNQSVYPHPPPQYPSKDTDGYLNNQPIPVINHRLTDRFFAHCPSHPNPPVKQIWNYSPADLTNLYIYIGWPTEPDIFKINSAQLFFK